ncbi:bifunctional (p)ppGpp synthetase/guanosine-3',5'-bis(diphosphate) 3'-pyrophosphohydrolase [Candidatus Kaiserbacteria bacterium]|nr:bifunctional (p)ppGpp synthetase/guanosine-3',5'-bis(diphosphate) 3'-pyrophosphohydrolase [Candidatus Kaiserbacteria bacterium]
MFFVVSVSGLVEPAIPAVARPPVNVVHRALLLARQVHAGERRKNAAQDPYDTHTTEVATLVAMAGGTEAEIASAHLHDSVESNRDLLPYIFHEFGSEIGRNVYGLTDPPEFKDLPTLERKGLQAARLLSKSRSIKLVKLADVTSNTRSLVADPPVSWSNEKCFHTLLGARLIAEVAQGESSFLDREFARMLAQAAQVYGPLPRLYNN